MAVVVGIILAIIVCLTVALIIRKRVYDQVDYIENWKLEITDRDVAKQIGQIKALNLSGETLEKFEEWKEEWEKIVTKSLPDVDNYLMSAEEAADRFLVPKAKKILNEAESSLEKIEEEIKEIISELEDLLHAEEAGREGAEELKPRIKGLRSMLSQSRYQYGKAEKEFDKEIDALELMLEQYDAFIEDGDYLKANESIQKLKESTETVENKLEIFPDLLKQVKQEIPSQLTNLSSGMKEMREDGYRIKHLGFEKEIITYQEQLKDMESQLEAANITDVEEQLQQIESRILEMYEALEGEAIAKNYVEQKSPEYEDSVEQISATFEAAKLEVEEIQKAYYVEDDDMERFQTMGKAIKALKNHVETLEQGIEDDKQSHSELKKGIEEGFKKIEELEEEHETFKKSIANLRKDELEARDKLVEMRGQLTELNRKIKKSNIPGVPSYIWTRFETAVQKNNKVMEALETYPLDMSSVQHALTEAKGSIEQAYEQVDMMLDQAYLTEQVIQYANRYRSKNSELDHKLKEAERLFRNFEYELSLEHAANAVEQVEPGSLKKIESYQAERSK
ncbi:septation ring formation regulator EzrA [Oceanobacillus jeddahense]|uniref:Septation ring formation regulator EzrA n=1 Tax=Oceanobacillus jeddahense TaxID=1462527 RepID=A0ABY5JPJ4_9BACI|nr:septation ring formation regulator EzrA [Oceanobacillus jeddahense]UUI01744.1 septation ring formation regulator EzrA [Oceanobacillus jeddahense]